MSAQCRRSSRHIAVSARADENRSGHRDATAILVAYRHGLRASEVVVLRWDAVPVVSNWGGTVVAVNVGGAVISTLMWAYLLIKRELWLKGLVATAIVALVIHWMADPVPGLGIAVPIFMPVLVTAVVAVILSRPESAPLAYIGGSLGTLIGADLTNLDKVRGLGAPVASIGGAGTFDGIFLTGILAVLLASLYARPRAAHAG